MEQVWFAGMHANVGGGYPDDSIAYIPYVWMLEKAEASGVVFKTSPPAIAEAKTIADSDGRMYNSRLGLGGFYRYGPRKLADLCNCDLADGDPVRAACPKIHESVFRRIKNGARFYAPFGLPYPYEIVPTDPSAPPRSFETPASSAARIVAQEEVWDLVVRRKMVYFLTVLTTGWLFIQPFRAAAARSDEFESSIRWVSDLVRLGGTVLPGLFIPWVNAYARSPFTFVIGVAAIALLMMWGARIEAVASERMGALWRASIAGIVTPQPYGSSRTRWRQTPFFFDLATRLRTGILPGLSALFIVFVVLSVANHILYDIQDIAGLVCQKTKGNGDGMALDEQKSVIIDAANICNDTGIDLEKVGTYEISIQLQQEWRDGSQYSDIGGFDAVEVPLPKRLLYYLGTPFRREALHPWFRLVARYGSEGGEEVFLDPDPGKATNEKATKVGATLEPKRDGRLFLFVNDAVTALPFWDLFYKNNHGTASVHIKRVPRHR